METTYPEKIVAFIDILGFGELVRRIGDDPALHAKIHSALTNIHHYKKSAERPDTAQSDLKVSVFSDSIVISAETSNFHGVMWTAVHLQCSLLLSGVLLRGGIARGRIVHSSEILYGEGLLNAHRLESKVAIYPRIVIDPSLIDEVDEGYRRIFLAQDTDGLWFIDPFSMGFLPGNSDQLVEDGYDPREEGLKYLGRIIKAEIARLNEPNHLAKWHWLKSRYKLAVIEFAEHGMSRFWRAWHLADQRKEIAAKREKE
jgi:hypothetical protein